MRRGMASLWIALSMCVPLCPVKAEESLPSRLAAMTPDLRSVGGNTADATGGSVAWLEIHRSHRRASEPIPDVSVDAFG
jgi:hypothetical protein